MSVLPEKRHPGTETCPICMDAIRAAARTTCMHVFCAGCLDLALRTGPPAPGRGEGFFQPACPLCRAPQGSPRQAPRAVESAETGDLESELDAHAVVSASQHERSARLASELESLLNPEVEGSAGTEPRAPTASAHVVRARGPRVGETANAQPPRRREAITNGGAGVRRKMWTRKFQVALSTMIFLYSASRFSFIRRSWHGRLIALH